MRKLVTILFSAGLMFFLSLPVNASIVGWNCNGGGAMSISNPDLTLVGDEYLLSMNGVQSGKPGNISGDFTTDAPGFDPTVRIVEYVTNDTTFAWTDYHIAIGMDRAFSILNTGLTMPDGWTTVITPVMPTGGNSWAGTVDYYQGTGSTVAIDDEGDFGLKVSFAGSTQYSMQQNPTPEPATIVLLGLGAIALRRRK